MNVIGIDALKNGLSYVRDNPLFLLRAAQNAVRLRLGIPIEALRWLLSQLPKGRGPSELLIETAPPALQIGAKVDLMGTALRVHAALHIDRLSVEEEQLLLHLRVQNLKVDAPPQSPIHQMLGAMDLTKPGNLLGFMPMRLPALVEARDDRFVFDLFKIPKLGKNQGLRRALGAAAQVLTIKDIQTEGDLLVIGFRISPLGVPSALARLRG